MTREVEQEREMKLTVRLHTYGNRKQARETAERVAQMLSVELHQDVDLVRAEYREVKP